MQGDGFSSGMDSHTDPNMSGSQVREIKNAPTALLARSLKKLRSVVEYPEAAPGKPRRDVAAAESNRAVRGEDRVFGQMRLVAVRKYRVDFEVAGGHRVIGRDWEGDDFVKKITGNPNVDRPLQRIREFRNRPNPKIVVSVDMLSTGVDIPALEYIVFLRPVKSR